MSTFLMIAAIWLSIGIAWAVKRTLLPPPRYGDEARMALARSNVVHLASQRASRVIGQSSSRMLHQRPMAANK